MKHKLNVKQSEFFDSIKGELFMHIAFKISCDKYGVKFKDLKNRSRSNNLITMVKRYAYQCTYDHTTIKLWEIGLLVDRDHSSVLYNMRELKKSREKSINDENDYLIYEQSVLDFYKKKLPEIDIYIAEMKETTILFLKVFRDKAK